MNLYLVIPQFCQLVLAKGLATFTTANLNNSFLTHSIDLAKSDELNIILHSDRFQRIVSGKFVPHQLENVGLVKAALINK